MKDIITLLPLVALLTIALSVGTMLGIELKNKNEKAKELTHQVDSLQSDIDSLNGIMSNHGILINDTSLSVVTNLNIQGEPYKYKNVRSLKKGTNRFYFVLNENTSIVITLDKY